MHVCQVLGGSCIHLSSACGHSQHATKLVPPANNTNLAPRSILWVIQLPSWSFFLRHILKASCWDIHARLRSAGQEINLLPQNNWYPHGAFIEASIYPCGAFSKTPMYRHRAISELSIYFQRSFSEASIYPHVAFSKTPTCRHWGLFETPRWGARPWAAARRQSPPRAAPTLGFPKSKRIRRGEASIRGAFGGGGYAWWKFVSQNSSGVHSGRCARWKLFSKIYTNIIKWLRR